MVTINVRGYELKGLNRLQSMELVLGDDMSSLTWLVEQMYSNFKATEANAVDKDCAHSDCGDAGEDKGSDDAGNEDDEDEGAGHDIATEQGEEPGQHDKDDAAVMSEILELKSSTPHVYWADSKHGFVTSRSLVDVKQKTFAVPRGLRGTGPMEAYVNALKVAKSSAIEYAANR